jgi:hypothetical protein
MTDPHLHLTEPELEALAHGRRDLVPAERAASTDVDGEGYCAVCAERLERERQDLGDAEVGLRRLAGRQALHREPLDLDAMVRTAMEQAPPPLPAAPSRRALALGLGSGFLATALAGLIAAPSPGAFLRGLEGTVRQVLTLGGAADHLVGELVPGGWIVVALTGLVVVAISSVPLRVLVRRAGALAVLLVLTAAAPSEAQVRVEGAFPQPPPTTSVALEDTPAVDALRAAAEGAGWGLVLVDPPPSLVASRVTLQAQDLPLPVVFEAIVGDDAPLDVRIGDGLLRVAGRVDAPAAPPSPPPDLQDRVTFGSDVRVGPQERVRDVITMGGDAEIQGVAFGDVVTMGGDATVAGEVVGNVVTMGGDLHIPEGGRVHGDLQAMGGEVSIADVASATGSSLEADASAPEPEGEGAGAVVLRFALLYLLGLFFLGAGRHRFAILQEELADRPVHNAVLGLVALIGALALTIAAAITLIGIPLALAVMATLFCAVCVGLTVAGWWIGSLLPFGKERPVLQLGMGMAILCLLSFVPLVNLLVLLFATLTGLGAVFGTRFGGRRR